jgi:purine catabolism regulator
VQNIACHLRGGELLLTTGLGLSHAAREIRRYVDDLQSRGIAGVVVELGSSWAEAPEALTARAEQHGLPVITLRREVRFVDITEAIHREIINRQFTMMRRGEEVRRELTQLLLRGGDLPDLLDAVAEEIGNPLVLFQHGRGITYHASSRATDAEVLGTWESYNRDLESGRQPLFEALSIPIAGADGTPWGRLDVLPLARSLNEESGVVAERAAGLVELMLYNDQREESFSLRERGSFLADLLSLRLSEGEAEKRAEDLGFPSHGPILPIAVTTRPVLAGADERGESNIWVPAWRALRFELASRTGPVLLGVRASARELLLVATVGNEPEHRQRTADAIAEATHRIAARKVGISGATIIGVGSVVESWQAVGDALREALHTARAGASVAPRSWHDATAPDIDRLLISLGDQPALRGFVERRLGPLLQHDQERASKLLPTLEAYLAHSGSKSETARALHVERQSLYNRLSKIEALLGTRLDSEEGRLGLHLAIRALQHLQHPVARGLTPSG